MGGGSSLARSISEARSIKVLNDQVNPYDHSDMFDKKEEEECQET